MEEPRDEGSSLVSAANDRVALTIAGRRVESRPGTTVLQAALDAGVYVPHLCSHPDLPVAGVCGLCFVEIEGYDGPVPSCSTEITEGMEVDTNSDAVRGLRRTAMELILSRHPAECTTCSQYLNCELQSLKQFVGITEELRVHRHPQPIPVDTGNPLFVRDMTKCVLCARCVRACGELRGVGALSYIDKGLTTTVGVACGGSLAEGGCRFCGACVQVCPTGALRDNDELTRGKNRRSALIPCRYTCPAEIDVPRYVALAREGDYPGATAVVREKAPFPLALGYVCDHPCEEVCRRGEVNEPLAIRELKRHAAERDDGSWKAKARNEPPTGKRVAIVGSGPAGLTAAYYLRRRGHRITVFEALPFAGGMLRVGIPAYRLPRQALAREVAEIEQAGVEIRLGIRVWSLGGLFTEGFEAVLVAVGAHLGRTLPVPGADLEGALAGLDFLRRVNLGEPVDVGRSVVVVGGGNVALDCARVARRLGATQVNVACLECRDHMPASAEEISEAEEEGVVIHPSRAFLGIAGDGGRVSAVECRLVQSFVFDEFGRLQIDCVGDSDHHLPAETVIMAVGQRPDIPEDWGLSLTPAGTVDLDPYTQDTGRQGVFAAGDAVSGTASVVRAIAAGRQAAVAIDRYLGGSGGIEETLAPAGEASPYLGPGDGFAYLNRCRPPLLPAPDRAGGFVPVLARLDDGEAVAEAERCLRCDLRLKITTARYWGDY